MLNIFRKRNPSAVDLSGLVADMHSHLIPGIDDGSPDMDMSLAMIRVLQEMGYRKLITTPHVMWEMFKNTPEKIEAGAEALRQATRAAGIEIEIRGAAEYFLDEHMDDLLEKNSRLQILQQNMVLVEFSFIRQPMDLKEKLFALQIKGYQPVLAHPERYLYFGADKEMYDTLKDMDCLFQLNLLSLCGYYGKKQEELAHYLIKKKYVSLLGTDMHNLRHASVLRSNSGLGSIVNRLLDSGAILNPGLA